MKKENIFHIEKIPSLHDAEIFEKIVNSGNVCIERIISSGHVTPPDKWYDQDKEEWVLLLQGNASLEFEDGSFIELSKGDFLHIPAYCKHRVSYTSSEPPCIWLAVHFVK